MSQQYSWEELLPIDEVQQAAHSLADIWHRVTKQKNNFNKFNFKKSEPKLTEQLHIYLCKLQREYGLTGFWTNEQQTPYYNKKGKLQRTRQDITYSSNLSKRFSLVFEFKKVTCTSSSFYKYKGESGMRRFVDGEYSIGEPLAAMAAIVNSDKNIIIDRLKKNIFQGKGLSTLALQKYPNEKCCQEPSSLLVSASEFDTMHERPPKKGPQKGNTIVLAHIFLSL